jgi:hypothetical protein
MVARARVVAKAAGKAVAKAAGKAVAKAKAKAVARAAGKAAGKGKAKAKAAVKAKAAGKAKAVGKARARAKAKAVAIALPPAGVPAEDRRDFFICMGVPRAPADVMSFTAATTIEELAEQIFEEEGIPLHEQRYIVEDARILSDYRLRVDTGPHQIPIETINGTLWVECRQLYDWDRVREAVEHGTGIAAGTQVLSVAANGHISVTQAPQRAAAAMQR